jgi:hypothetical protein
VQKDQPVVPFFFASQIQLPTWQESNGVSLIVYSAGLQIDFTQTELENRPDASGYVGWAGKMGSIKGSGMVSFFLQVRWHLCD